MINVYLLVAIVSVTVAGFSQILLKYAAGKERKNIFWEYCNLPVIMGYFLMAVAVFCPMIAYRFGIKYMTVALCEALGFVLVPVLSKVFFKDSLGKNKIVGFGLIIVGIVIYNIFG